MSEITITAAELRVGDVIREGIYTQAVESVTPVDDYKAYGVPDGPWVRVSTRGPRMSSTSTVPADKAFTVERPLDTVGSMP